MIELGSAELSVPVDPTHGGEILGVILRATGVDILGHPPFSPAAPLGGDLDEDTWTAGYRGGWQIAAPNAGAACDLDGVRHGFHGRASVDPWQVVESDPQSVVMHWSGHGLALRRRVRVTGPTVSVSLHWTAIDRPAPLIVVEHVCLGRAVLDPEVAIAVDARAAEMSETDGPVRPAAGAPRWPACRLLDGNLEHAGRWPFQVPRGRFAVLTDLEAGSAEIHSPARGVGVRLAWDADLLPAVWLWHEVRHSGGVWDGRAELLGFEPASVPHALGLAAAVRAGQALWAQPGHWNGYALSLTVTGGSGGTAPGYG